MTFRWASPAVKEGWPWSWRSAAPFLVGLFLLFNQGGKPAPLLALAAALSTLTALVPPQDLFSRGGRLPLFVAGGGLYFLWALVTALLSPAPLAAWRALAGISLFLGTAILSGAHWTAAHRRFWRMFIVVGTVVQSVVWLAVGKLLLPGNPQYASFWAAATLFLAFSLCVERGNPRWARAVGGAGLLAAFHLLWALPVRSGWVAAAVGALVYGASRFGRKGFWVAWLGVALAVSMAPARILKAEDATAFKRMDIWKAAVRGALDKPFAGWGLGQFESLYAHHALPQEAEPVRYDRTTAFAHNDPLQVFAATGLPGLLLAGAVLVGLWPSKRSTELAGEGAALSAGLVFSLFNFPLAIPANAWLAGGLAGGLWPSAREINTPATSRGSERVRRWVFVGAILWTGFNLVVAADSLRGDRRNPLLGTVDALWVEGRAAAADRLLHGGSPRGVDEAERIYHELLRGAPDRADLWRNLGHLEFEHRTGRLDAAASAYVAALDRKPTHAPWWLERGAIAARQADGEKAEIYVRRALSLEPRYVEAGLALGQLKRLRGDPSGAARWLTGLRSRAESWPRPGPGASAYQRAVLSRNESGLALALALCYIDLGRAAEALVELDGADRNNPEAWILRGVSLARAGQPRAAADVLRRGRARWPSDPRWENLMKSLKEPGRP